MLGCWNWIIFRYADYPEVYGLIEIENIVIDKGRVQYEKNLLTNCFYSLYFKIIINCYLNHSPLFSSRVTPLYFSFFLSSSLIFVYFEYVRFFSDFISLKIFGSSFKGQKDTFRSLIFMFFKN